MTTTPAATSLYMTTPSRNEILMTLTAEEMAKDFTALQRYLLGLGDKVEIDGFVYQEAWAALGEDA